ncbi:OmpA family protein [Aureibacter tunicatorum]|uniref:Outer membrane protein OmpA-like peptidoglycan-associated protein n=1 Tax=Aureibacter tunicatorum TaxID=866807 RepID=A0AAE3XNJ7_9BACT|nr:OmpA family protein [Aureibacter tunicatorum]MDR6239160.1 outer membrane protein OmpA-like peptidoglycan-associated protein [Aureibacter tunicatorum]BDD04914.1 hypothetical protein AUTU_23970 [Aureibacter tunicatorum]
MKLLNIFSAIALSCVTSLGVNAQLKLDSMVFTQPTMLKKVSSKSEDIKPMLSPDGNTLYFIRVFDKRNVGGKMAGQDIWYSKRTLDNGWTEPSNKNVNGWNNQDNNAILHISKDYKTVYLLDSYNKRKKNGKGFAVSEMVLDSTWNKPKTIIVEGMKPKYGFFDFTVSEDEKVIIASITEKEGVNENLFITFKDEEGNWKKPVNLSQSINTTGFEIAPFLVGDSVLYFSSDGHRGYGDADIFRSKRLDDTWLNWSEPENLGEEVNSSKFDAYFSLKGDDAFFASNRDGRFSSIFHSEFIPESELRRRQEEKDRLENERLLAEQEAQEKALALKKEQEAEAKKKRRAPSRVKPTISYKNIDMLTKGKMLDNTVIFFEFDSNELNENMKQIIRQWAYQLDENVEWRILVKGHTDDKGSEEYNKKLSEKRAIAAQEFISEQGINVHELIIEAKGEADPLEKNETDFGRMKNRRTEIYAQPIKRDQL